MSEHRSMRPHERLKTWQVAMDLVTEVYRLTKGFPDDERFGLTLQLRRASVSIPSNIAEGCARKSPKEKRQFLFVARGSLSELETQLHISRNLEYLSTDQHYSALERCGYLAALINGMLRKEVC